MFTYRITVAYDGTHYRGWQIQPGRLTIQETLEKALQPLSAPHECRVHGSGRTDAGVHARGQVAHFQMWREMRPIQLSRALNDALPTDIRVMEAAHAASDFDARRDAVGRQYRYFIWNGEVMPPEMRYYVAHVRNVLDLDAMRKAAGLFEGRHDFAAFSANPHREIESTCRRVFEVQVFNDGPRIEIRVDGEGFLYKMVRSMAGFLIAVGTGKEPPGAVSEVMESRVRTSRVETAPPQGLFLWRISY